jgi:hypothetical protein
MDAATLYMVLTLNGADRQEFPKHFESSAACEAYVSNFKKRLARLQFPASIKRYECMRWYVVSPVAE